MTLVAWNVGVPDLWEEGSVLVYASSAEEAIALARKSGQLHFEDQTYWEEATADRLVEADEFVKQEADKAYWETDSRILRDAGWAYEDDTRCQCCNLAPFGLDEFEVCEYCEQCPECGHFDDCPELDEAE